MFLHYLRIAWRSFHRHTWYSLINIGCLALGLAASMTILLYILHEHSYDRWHANARRIFAVYTGSSFGSYNFSDDALSYVVGPAGKAADPAVERMCRVRRASEGVDLQNPASPGARFREIERFVYADSNFFRFFSFRLLRGNPDNVLARPFSVVLTESATKKYFGNADPVGKTLTLDKQYTLQVTGVAADMPSNTSVAFDLVASLATMRGIDKYQSSLQSQQLESGTFLTWFLLRRPADTARVARSLSRVALVAAGKERKTAGPAGMVESHRFSLMPLAGTHLQANGNFNNPYLAVFTWVGALILLLALVNYMSLATARSAARAREVGVRKVIGAGRGKIAQQFYLESTLHAALAFAAGILLFLVFRPLFSRLMQISIDTDFLFTPMVIGAFGVLLIGVILVAGSYPSLVLSSFRPVTVLYGKPARQRGGEWSRKGFLVFQFTLSMALMTCAFVISKELYYIRHTDTGVARENVVMFPFDTTLRDFPAYRSEVARIPGIKELATTRYQLYDGTMFLGLIQLPGKTTRSDLMYVTADSNFIPLLGLKWKEQPIPGVNWVGRSHLVLNEAAVASFHWTGRATDNHFSMGKQAMTVAGVLKDFNFLSLHEAIAPLGLQIFADQDSLWARGLDGVLYAKIAPHFNLPELIEAVHRTYSRYDDHTPFEYTFLDDDFNRQYKAEDRLAGLMNIFTSITIVIACLGLFALATFAAQQRLKEIGIRKVLGASVASIGALLSWDFLRPVLLSIVIASPLSWWIMHRWLQDFAYRTEFSWWVFPLAGGALLLVALGTVLFRALGAARVNPVSNLRSE
jgi:putative ABC transport system permease protein